MCPRSAVSRIRDYRCGRTLGAGPLEAGRPTGGCQHTHRGANQLGLAVAAIFFAPPPEVRSVCQPDRRTVLDQRG